MSDAGGRWSLPSRSPAQTRASGWPPSPSWPGLASTRSAASARRQMQGRSKDGTSARGVKVRTVLLYVTDVAGCGSALGGGGRRRSAASASGLLAESRSSGQAVNRKVQAQHPSPPSTRRRCQTRPRGPARRSPTGAYRPPTARAGSNSADNPGYCLRDAPIRSHAGTRPTTHNRLVLGSNPSGPTNRNTSRTHLRGSWKTGWTVLRLWTRTSDTNFWRVALRCGMVIEPLQGIRGFRLSPPRSGGGPRRPGASASSAALCAASRAPFPPGRR